MAINYQSAGGKNIVSYNQKGVYHCTACGNEVKVGRNCPHCKESINWKKIIILLDPSA